MGVGVCVWGGVGVRGGERARRKSERGTGERGEQERGRGACGRVEVGKKKCAVALPLRSPIATHASTAHSRAAISMVRMVAAVDGRVARARCVCARVAV